MCYSIRQCNGIKGSIPLFVGQIIDNKDLTITDPDMTRFLMSLEDSVDLVLHAFKNAQQGDIFVQKAPASTIQVLAKALNRLYTMLTLILRLLELGMVKNYTSPFYQGKRCQNLKNLINTIVFQWIAET